MEISLVYISYNINRYLMTVMYVLYARTDILCGIILSILGVSLALYIVINRQIFFFLSWNSFGTFPPLCSKLFQLDYENYCS
jgi:hypothetical protein